MRDLTMGRPMKQILLFTLPILIGSILQLTYSLVDTRVVGSVLGDTALEFGVSLPLTVPRRICLII